MKLPLTAALIALALPASAGGISTEAPSEFDRISQPSRSYSVDRDRINDEGRCSNRIMCPRWKWLGLPNPHERVTDVFEPEKPHKPPHRPEPEAPVSPSPVPLPAGGLLLGAALVALRVARRKA